MQSLHFPYQGRQAAVTEIVSPKNAPLRWLSVHSIRLNAENREAAFSTVENEAVLDIFGGKCTVNIASESGSALFPEIGSRPNVFAGKPTMVYIPRGSSFRISADSPEVEAALITAPARKAYHPALISPEDVISRAIGQDNWRRNLMTGVGENVKADRLLIGETINPPGNWSSSPPHKHDQPGYGESPMEEVYLYKLNPPQGFGLQRVYTPQSAEDPFDFTYAVQDGDVVALPRGYHPVVAAPGYQLFYLWALAGEERAYGAWSDDPTHAWIKS